MFKRIFLFENREKMMKEDFYADHPSMNFFRPFIKED